MKFSGLLLFFLALIAFIGNPAALAKVPLKKSAYFRDDAVKKFTMTLHSVKRIPAAMGTSAVVILGQGPGDLEAHELELDPSWKPAYQSTLERAQRGWIDNKAPEQTAVGIIVRRRGAANKILKQQNLELLVDRGSIIYARPDLLLQMRDLTAEMTKVMEAEEKEGKYWPYPTTMDGEWTKNLKPAAGIQKD